MVLFLSKHNKNYFEFHGRKLVNQISHVVSDSGPGHFVFGLSGGFDGVAGEIIEADHVLEHADGLIEGAETIVVGVSVLLKEVVLKWNV